MLFISARKVWSIVAIVMAGMVVVALVGCQVHAASHDQPLASPAGHHRVPSPHAALDLNCLVASLPIVGFLLPVYLYTPYTTDRLAHPTGFASPPFIPPEAMLRVHSA